MPCNNFKSSVRAMPVRYIRTNKSGFTVLELLVAVSVTALLAGMLLNITSQVVTTQTRASSDLETNQIAQFVLDRIQEDLHCAVYRNDGNVWMAASIYGDSISTNDIPKSWVTNDGSSKPTKESVRIVPSDWTERPNDLYVEENNQFSLMDSRFGKIGTFLRFFTIAPEQDTNLPNNGGARAISYRIIRHGLTKSVTSRPRYQLFRADVSTEETFLNGYNLYADDMHNGTYGKDALNGAREPGNIFNPIYEEPDADTTAFSLASNIIDFGIRLHTFQKNKNGETNLLQIFPDVNSSNGGGYAPYEYYATSFPKYIEETQKDDKYSKFPDVVDVMIRILSTEGASAISAYEEGLIPTPSGFTPEEYWWEIAEKNSEVYIRRIRVFASGI